MLVSRVGAGGVREITTVEPQDSFTASGTGTFQQQVKNLTNWPVCGKAGVGVAAADTQSGANQNITAGTSDP